MRFLDHPDLAKLLLRAAPAAMMIYAHGWSKITRILSGNFEFANPIGIGEIPSLVLATFAEFVCSCALIAGYRTRLAAIPLIITMCVAAFIQHASDPFARKELPLLYGTAFAAVMLLGPGRFSADKS